MNRNDTGNADFIRKIPWIILAMLVVLRTAVGWHFLYEGVAKLFVPDWTASGYLQISKWIFSGVFKWMASSQPLMLIIDVLNIAGLILIGLGLMLGCFSRIAALSGAALLFLYYTANPPFVGMDFGVVTEGNYLIVDKNFIELIVLLIMAVIPTGRYLGIDRLIVLLKAGKTGDEVTIPATASITESSSKRVSPALDRREILRNLVSVPVLGVFILAVFHKYRWESYEEKLLEKNADAVSRSTIRTFNFSSLNDLHGQVPHTKIKGVDFSRVILGGNLIGGWAHARDLIYASKLVKAYHHREKIFETFLLAEKCGINAFLTNPMLAAVINEYWRRDIGKIKFISDSGWKNLQEGIKFSVDMGAAACYTHGGLSDQLVKEGKVEEIGKALDLIRQNGLPAGIGGHNLDTVKACVDYGLKPDFWMKTFHHTNYWSAKPGEEHDNIWCKNPDETMAYMRNLKQPWIAFKTLAAGAIHPEVGFHYAFKGGADFICVGMYDFQIVDDVNIALDVLKQDLPRERPWMA